MNNFRDRIEERVEEIVPFTKNDPTYQIEIFKYLFKRMEKFIPIGTFNRKILLSHETTFVEDLNEIDNLLLNGKESNSRQINEKLKNIFGRVCEEPCAAAEIINTGWLFKIENIYKNMIDNLHLISIDNDLFMKENLLSLDALLKNSIETSYLCHLLTNEDCIPQ